MSEVEPLNADEELKLANFLIFLKDPVAVACDYKNWRGETSRRRFKRVPRAGGDDPCGGKSPSDRPQCSPRRRG